MQDKKIKFSNVISTVKIERGVLKIRQLRLFALTFMIGFLGSLIWIGLNVAQKFPLIVQAGLLFSGLILVWGVYDVATSKVVFNYFIESDLVQIKARKKAFKLNYNGSAKSV